MCKKGILDALRRTTMEICDSIKYQEEIKKIASQIPYMNASILVTGATGMIGSCIVDTILMANKRYGNDIELVALGRDEIKLKKRFSYADQTHISYIVQDITKPLVTERNIDFIVHAASNADPISYSLYPAETILTNIYGTNNMLKYCKEHNKTRILLTSTFETYGRIEGKDTYYEEDSGEIDLNSIRSCYPESKRCAEILCKSYNKEYGVDHVIARLGSIYGPTMSENDSKAHAQFIRNALKGKEIVLKSKGIQKRTYCYLMDAVSGIFFILFKGESGEAYNISNDKSIVSIAELAETIASICGTTITFEIPDAIEAQGYSRPQDCILNNDKLKKLGWKGEYPIKEGIISTISIIRETMH